MKKLVFISLVAVLLASLILSGCGSSSPAPTTAPTATSAPAPKPTSSAAPTTAPTSTAKPAAPAGKTWELRFSHGQSRTSLYQTLGHAPWGKDLEAATQGRVKVTYYTDNILAPGNVGILEAVKSNICQVAYANSAYFTGMMDLSDVATLPFLIPSGAVGSKALWNLVQKYPEMQDQYKDVKLISIWTTEPYYFVGAKKHFKTMDDFKGMKLRMGGGPPTDMLKLLGGIPTLFLMSDCYMNMQKGVIDGAAVPSEAVIGFKFYEVAPYYTYAPTVSAVHMLMMNKDTWNEMPKDIQDAIMNVSGEKQAVRYGKEVFDDAKTDMAKTVKAAGFKMNEYTVPADEMDKWKAVAGKPVWDSWVKKMEAKGFKNASKIVDDLNALVKQYSK